MIRAEFRRTEQAREDNLRSNPVTPSMVGWTACLVESNMERILALSRLFAGPIEDGNKRQFVTADFPGFAKRIGADKKPQARCNLLTINNLHLKMPRNFA